MQDHRRRKMKILPSPRYHFANIEAIKLSRISVFHRCREVREMCEIRNTEILNSPQRFRVTIRIGIKA